MAQVNITNDPSVPGLIRIMPTSDPTTSGVIQVNINADPTAQAIIQAQIISDPTTKGLVFVNFNSLADNSPLTSPINITLPVITGIGQVGQTIMASAGTWSYSPSSYGYQWYRNGVAVGTNSSNYTCVSGDTAKTITVSVIATNSVGSSSPALSVIPNFGLYSSTLGGSVQTLLLSLSTQETNHAKQSASLGLVAATIYTAGTPAEEGGSSLGTGIILINPNVPGQYVTAVTPDSTLNNSNPIWSVVGDFFVYSTTNVSSGNTGCRKHIPNGANTQFYAPSDINVSDFSLDASNNLLMSGHGASVLAGKGSALFIRAADTGTRYQLTTPTITGTGNPLGDFDPSWSPDATKVACVRATATAGIFSICVITVDPESGGGGTPFQNRGELLIASIGSSTSFWGVPSWSSDGSKIIAALYDPQNLSANGIYSMNPDGTMPARIALRAEEYYNTPRFIPDGGSSATAGILYSTRIIPIFPASGGGGGPSLILGLDMTLDTLPLGI